MTESLSPGQPDGDDAILLPAPPTRRPARRVALITSGAVLLAGVAGAAAWGYAKLSGGGPGAASVVPANALMYAAVDLDPSASQKIEAYKTLRKFPGLDKELGKRSDDLREAVIDAVADDSTCDLDYDRDVLPWIGQKLGVAALAGKNDNPDVVVALAVDDQDKARAGIEKLFSECSDDHEFGIAFLDGYALVAQSDDIVAQAVAEAKKAALADDDQYNAALDSLGDIGIATYYLAPSAKDWLQGQSLGGVAGDTSALSATLGDFDSVAATLRFSGGAIELAGVTTGLGPATAATPRRWAELPGTTVAALGFPLQPGWGQKIVDSLNSTLAGTVGSSSGSGAQDWVSEVEDETGLKLPDDLEAFFGSGVTLALDERSDFGALNEFDDPSALQIGVVLDSKLADVQRVYGALNDAFGLDGSVFIGGQDGKVTVAFARDYADELGTSGGLGDTQAFADAVPNASTSLGGIYVDFNGATNWLTKAMTDLGAGADDVKNAEPLSSFGASVWRDGDDAKFVARLQTD